MMQTFIVNFVLSLTNRVKLVHWLTEDYSVHKIFDDLYSKLQENGDKLVESVLGLHTEVVQGERISISRVKEPKNPVKFLLRVTRALYDMNKIFKNYPEIQAIIQDMSNDVHIAVYLCRMK